MMTYALRLFFLILLIFEVEKREFLYVNCLWFDCQSIFDMRSIDFISFLAFPHEIHQSLMHFQF